MRIGNFQINLAASYFWSIKLNHSKFCKYTTNLILFQSSLFVQLFKFVRV